VRKLETKGKKKSDSSNQHPQALQAKSTSTLDLSPSAREISPSGPVLIGSVGPAVDRGRAPAWPDSSWAGSWQAYVSSAVPTLRLETLSLFSEQRHIKRSDANQMDSDTLNYVYW
jgi:hypothetical protein